MKKETILFILILILSSCSTVKTHEKIQQSDMQNDRLKVVRAIINDPDIIYELAKDTSLVTDTYNKWLNKTFEKRKDLYRKRMQNISDNYIIESNSEFNIIDPYEKTNIEFMCEIIVTDDSKSEVLIFYFALVNKIWKFTHVSLARPSLDGHQK